MARPTRFGPGICTRDNQTRPTTDFKVGLLKSREIVDTRNRLLRVVQAESFKDEILCIEHNKEIAKSSSLKLLNPLLDDSGLLRVGGPYYVKDRTRNRITTKANLCIVVRFATKAVHLELAVDLTTDAFLSCLQHFVSRRGRPQGMFSDNGTNFVGAKNEFNDLARLLLDTEHEKRVTNFSSREGINWHFIPAHAPHFGGLWESAVKSVKHHLKRVIGESRLTFA
ncbi:uncharacterized protein LOC117181203 [Belonocnema kinseyi]|uniref:uncharacterized protein LOC117181203 n=1 Tax=Belonocnema kinseyi TaxID=2817044 RepID=UPI00143CF1C2|nr:uncharacterized protein LOC117181203 [Belonocnema kinseyi]